jgi:hypothetical protein
MRKKWAEQFKADNDLIKLDRKDKLAVFLISVCVVFFIVGLVALLIFLFNLNRGLFVIIFFSVIMVGFIIEANRAD